MLFKKMLFKSGSHILLETEKHLSWREVGELLFFWVEETLEKSISKIGKDFSDKYTEGLVFWELVFEAIFPWEGVIGSCMEEEESLETSFP